ncbi:hypothetical protein BDZ85DRAFT_265564 [Elsinoe ampelina]|uniref:Uncharacterized protein n=1 Tax=Elsinoe ampelina TaxID=302913 RepID=A0A6A6G7L4_9PEZI|nr:hypothetical protein BDZ85DRAFT_265564 [Elsinoe ampelina]
MYRRNDPRFRRTLNEISQTIESANETAQARVYVFGQEYINPCFSGVLSCFRPCIENCCAGRDQRGNKTRGRGRAELNFDFYDDWEEDEADGLLGWDDEEYDGFFSGPGSYGATQQQPARQRAMSYGTRRDARGRRGSNPGAEENPSYFGFLGKLTGKLGQGKGLRYKPSAAGLQEHPGASKKQAESESEPLMTDDSDVDAVGRRKRHGRNRSGTNASQQTTSSFSSRGDIFPSEDEDDAVMLDDEFAMVLERRNTGTGSGPDDGSSGIISSNNSKRPRLGSRKSTRSRSSRNTPRSKRSSRAPSSDSPPRAEMVDPEPVIIPTLNELKQEEEQARLEEEAALHRRRSAAQKLAEERGLSATNSPTSIRTPTARSTPERQSSHHQEDLQRMSQIENAVSSIATIRPPTTPSRVSSAHDLQSSKDEFGDFQDSPSIRRAPAEQPVSSSFEAARLPRFS